jgi:hypothetical protein
VLGAVIGFAIPGGGEVIGTVGAEAGAEAGEAVINEIVVELPDEISEDALGQIDEETSALESSSEEAAASVEGKGSTWSQFKGWLARNATKIKYGIMGSVAGGVVGGVAGMVPSMLEAAANGNIQKLPTLDNLASTAAQPTTWPEQKTYKLQSAALNHSWQIGCHPGFAD